MLSLIYNFIKDFGSLSVTSIQFIVIGVLAYKFATNHWKHLTADITGIKKSQKDMSEKLDEYGQRISTVEGQLK